MEQKERFFMSNYSILIPHKHNNNNNHVRELSKHIIIDNWEVNKTIWKDEIINADSGIETR